MAKSNSKNDNKLTLFDIIFTILFIIGCWYFFDRDSFLKVFSSNNTKKDDIEEKIEVVEKTRTIIVYMSPSTLESENGFASGELRALDKNRFDFKHNNFLVLAGGSNKWNNNFSIMPKIYRFNESGNYEVVDECIDHTNMGDPNTFSYFLKFAKTNYEADEYIVYLFGHGYGVDGLLPDEVSGDYLSLKELNSSFTNSPLGYKHKVDLFIANSCLIGTIETLENISYHAKHAITTEELGWIFTSYPLFDTFNNLTPDKDLDTFSHEYIDLYKRSVQSVKTDTTMTLVDLEEVADLFKYVHDLFGSIDVNKNYSLIKTYRASFKAISSDELLDEVDLVKTMNTFYTFVNNNKKDEFSKQLKKTILYSHSSSSDLSGISIWFPYHNPNNQDDFFVGNEFLYDYGSGYRNFVSEFIRKQKEEYGI